MFKSLELSRQYKARGDPLVKFPGEPVLVERVPAPPAKPCGATDFTPTYKIFVKLTAGPKGAWKEAPISHTVNIDRDLDLIMGMTRGGNNFMCRIAGHPQKYPLPIDKKVIVGSYTVVIKRSQDTSAPKVPELEKIGDSDDDAIDSDDDNHVDSIPPYKHQQYPLPVISQDRQPMQNNFAHPPQDQPQFILVGTDAGDQPIFQARQ